MRTLTVVVSLCAVSVWGCGRTNQAGGGSISGQTNPSGHSTVQGGQTSGDTAAVQSDPEWLTQLNKAVTLFGKSKDDVVKAFGEPDSTGDGYGYPLSANQAKPGWLWDEETADGVDLAFGRAKPEQTCDTVWVTFSRADYSQKRPEHRQPASAIWKALKITSEEPEETVNRIIQWPKAGEYTCSLLAHLPSGAPVSLSVVSSAPLTVTKSRFNTATDRREETGEEPNPAFQWQNCLVSRVTIAEPGKPLHFQKIQGYDHTFQ
jgi:hypothetical protein